MTIKILNSVRVNNRLNISINDFYKNLGTAKYIDATAAVLGIHPSTIKIVGIREGSTIITLYIKSLLEESTN